MLKIVHTTDGKLFITDAPRDVLAEVLEAAYNKGVHIPVYDPSDVDDMFGLLEEMPSLLINPMVEIERVNVG